MQDWKQINIYQPYKQAVLYTQSNGYSDLTEIIKVLEKYLTETVLVPKSLEATNKNDTADLIYLFTYVCTQNTRD